MATGKTKNRQLTKQQSDKHANIAKQNGKNAKMAKIENANVEIQTSKKQTT